jgi:two-component system phosphate regulon sensor histidine kinase PhoR
LAEANERLQELDRLKSKFVYDVTHELRTPVTNLKLYLDLWERGHPENREKYITVIREQSNRLEHLISDILSLSRLQKDETQKNSFVPVDLNKLTTKVIETHRPHAEAAELELRFEPDPDLPLVLGKENDLAQVVANLVANAINYTSAGHVHVSIQLDAEREQVCLQVRDTGMGIAQEEFALIFERFYRGERTGQFNIPGTGLGLAIVKEIIDQHNGTIRVQSEVDVGSTFWVWLPPAKL